LINPQGVKVRTAGPSAAVKCLGLTSVPEAGEGFEVYPNDRDARSVAEELQAEKRKEELQAPQQRGASLEELLLQTAQDGPVELAVVLKADVQGSLEAIEQSLLEIKSDKVKLKFVLSGVGNITENDVLLASASNAIVLGFHVGLEGSAKSQAKRDGVEIRLYSVIYELLDDVREAMTGLLEPETKEHIIGHAEIRQVFTLSKRSRVAGCMVKDGRVTARSNARVMRDGDIVYTGRIASLKRFQNDAREIREGQECGIRLDNFIAFKEDDVIECFEVERVAQEL
jgi:translation initiation factor IF-2